jgi:hypothetical protein
VYHPPTSVQLTDIRDESMTFTAPGAPPRTGPPATRGKTNGLAENEGGRDASGGRDGSSGQGCTQAQLRRFIKSRPYVPMHELRRRFDINGEADDVVPVDTPEGRFWVGLPSREGDFLADLVSRGEVGLETCHDPCVNMVIGVFAMKPVSR